MKECISDRLRLLHEFNLDLSFSYDSLAKFYAEIGSLQYIKSSNDLTLYFTQNIARTRSFILAGLIIYRRLEKRLYSMP